MLTASQRQPTQLFADFDSFKFNDYADSEDERE